KNLYDFTYALRASKPGDVVEVKVLRDGKVYVGGTGTGSTFEELLERVAGRHKLKLDTAKSGYSSSDHTVFVSRNIPVLFFFSGLHSDYHKPSDTWDKINAEEAAELVELVGDLTAELAGAERPQFVRVTPETSGHPAALGSTGSGYGAYFGSIPDFGEIENGVRFADIRPGSPADKAGIKPGDILVEFRGRPIKNLYDFTYALRASKPGDVVEVKVLRDGKTVSAQVTLGRRK
ncbi:MAG TPA: PDZ domain-containing protein, partial [Bryobacterales bacterium]|nr:PDZ domain-containing protein [Bryobacterales bacterium]